MKNQSATCIVDARDLVSACDPDSDDYIDSPLFGYLTLTLVRIGQRDVRKLSFLKADGVTPLNLSSQVHSFIFQNMGWRDDESCNDPSEHCLGDCLANSGLDGYCIEGRLSKFEIDVDRLSPSFGKIFFQYHEAEPS
jgi:hypothetical protein